MTISPTPSPTQNCDLIGAIGQPICNDYDGNFVPSYLSINPEMYGINCGGNIQAMRITNDPLTAVKISAPRDSLVTIKKGASIHIMFIGWSFNITGPTRVCMCVVK